jgi:hypothetical protein
LPVLGVHRGEGACRLLAEHVDIRTIQLMLGHADINQTRRHLNITDEEPAEDPDQCVGAPASVEGRPSVRLKPDTSYES